MSGLLDPSLGERVEGQIAVWSRRRGSEVEECDENGTHDGKKLHLE